MPYLAASPDGIATCKCLDCDYNNATIVLEVKCPYTYKDGLPTVESLPSSFFLTRSDDEWELKTDHAYYYQIQLQLYIYQKFSQKEVKCDFLVWTSKQINVQRILLNESFIDEKLQDLEHFFVNAILPEIVGKWYSRKPIASNENLVEELPETSTSSSTSNQDTEDEDYTISWCFCNKPSYGDMILCDNTKCTIKWFHFDCLSIRSPPKGKWYCPSCCKLPKYRRKKQ